MVLERQVPPEFRRWVCQFVKVWFTDGRLAATQLDGIPLSAPPNFREWLVAYLDKTMEKQEVQAAGAMEQDNDLPVPSEGVFASYYQWLCLYVKQFLAQNSSDSDSGKKL